MPIPNPLVGRPRARVARKRTRSAHRASARGSRSAERLLGPTWPRLPESTRAAAPSYGVFAAEVLGRFQRGMGEDAGEAVAPQSNVPQIKSRKIPHYLTRGTGDFLIGKEAVQAYADALAEKGQLTVHDEVEGAGHAFFDWKPNSDVKATFQQYGVPYAAKMREFFVEHLDAD